MKDYNIYIYKHKQNHNNRFHYVWLTDQMLFKTGFSKRARTSGQFMLPNNSRTIRYKALDFPEN